LEGTKTYHLVVISKDDAFAVFWEENLLYYHENAAIEGEGLGFFAGGNSSSWMNIDTIMFWDLEGDSSDQQTEAETESTAFFDTVKDYMDSQPTTYEEDFSNPDTVTGEVTNKINSKELLLSWWTDNGYLNIPSGVYSYGTPVDTSDFILSFDFLSKIDFESFSVSFRNYRIVFMDGGRSYSFSDRQNEPDYILAEGNLDEIEPLKFYNILIVAKGNKIGVKWEDEVLYYNSEALQGDPKIRFRFNFDNSGEQEAVILIDNHQFWDLEGVEISEPVEAESEPTPTEALGVGSTKVNEVDGAKMVYVPAGDFLMGSEDGENDESPKHTVYLDAYWIYKYEVTNAQYRQCIEAGVCNGSINSYPDDNYPAGDISWNEADAYCTWAEGRLPTEAEWEKAARGTDGRTYPWGEDNPTCSLANYSGCSGGTTPVGSFPAGASPYGALDMAGNVWELVADWYDEDYYANSPDTNPTGPGSGSLRVLRGSSWDVREWYLRVSARWKAPVNPNDNRGFRCIIEGDEHNYQAEAEPEPTEAIPSPTPTPSPDWVTDFAEPILAYIGSLPPSVEDPFLVEVENEKDTYGDMWVFNTTCAGTARSLSVNHGEISINCNIVNQAVTFQDYVVEVDTYLPETNIVSVIWFNKNSCEIHLGFSNISVWCDKNEIFEKGISQQTGWKNLRLIVKGSSAAIYLDEQPLGYFEIENKGLPVYLSIGPRSLDYNTQRKFRNFKAWSLTYFNFP